MVKVGLGDKQKPRRDISDTEDSRDMAVSCDISCKNGRQNIERQRAYDAQFPKSDVSGYNSPGTCNSSCLAPLEHTFLAADICHATFTLAVPPHHLPKFTHTSAPMKCMNHNFHATALCKMVLPEIAPCEPRDMRLPVWWWRPRERERQGSVRKTNRPTTREGKSSAGSSPFTGNFS